MSGFAEVGLVQRTLFNAESHDKQRQLDAVADAVRAAFGSSEQVLPRLVQTGCKRAAFSE